MPQLLPVHLPYQYTIPVLDKVKYYNNAKGLIPTISYPIQIYAALSKPITKTAKK